MRKLFELLRRAIVLATLFPIVLGGMVGCAESGTGIVKVELENSDTGKMHTPWRPVSTKRFDFREPPSLPQKNQGFKHMLGEHVAVLREECKKAVGVQWDPPGDIPPPLSGDRNASTFFPEQTIAGRCGSLQRMDPSSGVQILWPALHPTRS